MNNYWVALKVLAANKMQFIQFISRDVTLPHGIKETNDLSCRFSEIAFHALLC